MNRIASRLADNDFRIGRGTIGGLLSKATAVFSRLQECLRQAVLEDSYISGDETFHKVRVEEKNDKGLKIKKGYIWNLVAHHLRLAYFFYSGEQGRRKSSRKSLKDITVHSRAMPCLYIENLAMGNITESTESRVFNTSSGGSSI